MLSQHRRFRFVLLLIALTAIAAAHQTKAVESTIVLPVQISIPRFLLLTLTSGEISESQSTASGTLNLRAPVSFYVCPQCDQFHATINASIQSNADWRLSFQGSDLPGDYQWSTGELHEESGWNNQTPLPTLSGGPTEWIEVTVHLRTSGEAPVGGVVVASAIQK